MVDILNVGIVLDTPVAAAVAAAAAPATPVAAQPVPSAPKKVRAAPKTEAQPTQTSEPVVEESEPPDVSAALEAAFDPDFARRHSGRKPVPRAHPKPAGSGKKPCPLRPENERIVASSEWSWRVERDLVDYYASHVKELVKLGSVRPNQDAEGRPAGFRVGIGRCSILREGGLRSGDVVSDINGIRVHDLFGAVAAYFKLKKQSHIVVHVLRKGVPLTLEYDLI
jgi:general secretion pathway protein C